MIPIRFYDLGNVFSKPIVCVSKRLLQVIGDRTKNTFFLKVKPCSET